MIAKVSKNGSARRSSPTTVAELRAATDGCRLKISWVRADGWHVTLKFLGEITAEQIFPDPIVTEVTPLETFYEAEDYHQDYYKYNSQQPYCQVVIAPKVAKFRSSYAHKLKASK